MEKTMNLLKASMIGKTVYVEDGEGNNIYGIMDDMMWFLDPKDGGNLKIKVRVKNVTDDGEPTDGYTEQLFDYETITYKSI